MVTTDEQKLKKYSKESKLIRSSEEIQKPMEENIKYQIPADLVEEKPITFVHCNIPLRSHDQLELHSKTVMKFIRGEK